MKLYYILAFCVFTFSSCEFDLFDEVGYVTPQITIDLIEQVDDTTFLHIAIAEQKEPITNFGIAYLKDDIPEIYDNQITFDGASGKFVIPLFIFDTETEYNILAFATNEYAIGISDMTKFSAPKRTADEVPCEVQKNEIKFAPPNVGTNNRSVSSSSIEWQGESLNFEGRAFRIKFDLTFTSFPTTAIYKTVRTLNHSPLASREVIFTANDGDFFRFDEGQSIYVEKLRDREFSISFCDVETEDGSTISGNAIFRQ